MGRERLSTERLEALTRGHPWRADHVESPAMAREILALRAALAQAEREKALAEAAREEAVARSRIDERQCEELTHLAGDLATRLAAAEAKLAQAEQDAERMATAWGAACSRAEAAEAKLAQAEGEKVEELTAVIESIPDHVRVHNDGGIENLYSSLAVSVVKLQAKLAQAEERFHAEWESEAKAELARQIDLAMAQQRRAEAAEARALSAEDWAAVRKLIREARVVCLSLETDPDGVRLPPTTGDVLALQEALPPVVALLERQKET